MKILQIDKENIKSIATYILSNKDSAKKLVTKFKGTVSIQEVDKEWLKFIITSNDVIKAIIIDSRNNIVTGVTFSGVLNITYADLIDLFDKNDEYYERYDDIIEYFFKDREIDNYKVKCFIPNDDKKKNNWQDNRLENISILFP